MLYVKKLALLVAGIAIFHFGTAASEYQYLFDQAFSGAAPAASNSVWMGADFRDISAGTVQLTVSNLNLTGAENVDQLYLNLNPALDPTKLQFTFVSGSGGFDLPSIMEGTNAFKADGDGEYDILFNFTHNSNSQHQFTQGEYFTFDITGITGLTAADFAYLSFPDGGVGPFYAAAHIQRIGSASLSGWISADMVTPITPIPEPSAAAIIAIALSLYIAVRLGKRASKSCAEVRRLRPIPVSSRPCRRGRGR